MPSSFNEQPKSKWRKLAIALGALILASEVALFSWLNLSLGKHEVEFAESPGSIFVYKSYYGWPATYFGEKFERGVGSSRMRAELRQRTFQSYFNAIALSVNVGVAIGVIALSTIVVVIVSRYRYSLQLMFLLTMLVAVLSALFVAVPHVSREPPGW